LDAYAAVVDQTYVEEREGRVLTFRRHLEPLERLTGPANGRRLLDVGCHIGVFLEIAAERGWDAWGVEPSHWAAEQARRRGLNVKTGTLSEAGFADHSFDVVTLWDVIEHLSDPRGELEKVNRVLKPGGLLCIHTMDIESPLARLMGRRWPWFMEMHLYYFSRATLSAFLMKTGFQVIRSQTQGRFLRLGYLMSRLQAFSPPLAKLLVAAVRIVGVAELAVPINLGDLFTTYARKVRCLHS
jgi:2-polyprenyl-3-methyl-5-hydroxy-6-metoxy-1,4-benzoquinol methylase